MKKLFAMLLTLALLLYGMAALAEAAEAAEGTKINCLIEGGSFIIQIDDPEGDLGWVADDMSQDDSVVKLYDADLIEDTFVVRYDPVGDGDVTVAVRHYTGIACDEIDAFELRVEGGAVVENLGGMYAGAPDESEWDAWLLGKWLEQETQFTQLTVEKNPERGWDVEAAAPLTHGAYIFKATVYYDCELASFVYANGTFWDVPITESEEEVELGEATIENSTGTFTFGGDEDNILLVWTSDVTPEEAVVFERATE